MVIPLIHYLFGYVYELISECPIFEDAIRLLNEIFDKPKNLIFARHTNNSIRQRLLEHTTLSLKDAVNTVQSLESAQTTAQSFITQEIYSASTSYPSNVLGKQESDGETSDTLSASMRRQGKVLVRNFTRQTKSDPLVHPIDIISSTQLYARIRYIDGREITVLTSDLAPPAYEDIENDLPVKHANDGDLDREVGVPTLENHLSMHVQSSTNIPQSQEEEPVNDQADAKDPMRLQKQLYKFKILFITSALMSARLLMGKIIRNVPSLQKVLVECMQMEFDPDLNMYFNKSNYIRTFNENEKVNIGDIVIISERPKFKCRNASEVYELREIVYKVGQLTDPLSNMRCRHNGYLFD
ncbi:hypothetical protein GJ496_007546 [Pomphorhynchus laevis]|nr:hypothetical protein GJ496_007546 [Pomphorhynchus laevis]